MPESKTKGGAPGWLRGLAILFGVAVLVVAWRSWFEAPTTPVTTVTESVAPVQNTTKVVGTGASAAASPQRTTVSNGATYKTTTTTGPSDDRRSEALTLALLGLGAVLVLAGSGIVSSIGGPGGWNVQLATTVKDNTLDLRKSIAAARGYTTKQATQLAVSIVELQKRVAELEAKDKNDG